MATSLSGTRGRAHQHGVAMVEFTIMLPLLLILFVGAAEMGRLIYDYNTLTKAQRNGIRHLAIHAERGNTDIYVASGSQYATEATNLVVFGNIAGTGDAVLSGFTVADVVVDDPTQDEVRVSVTYAYTPMVFNSIPGFGLFNDIDLTMNLNSSVTMTAMRGG